MKLSKVLMIAFPSVRNVIAVHLECGVLSTVTIPTSVTNIGGDALRGTLRLVILNSSFQ